MCSLDCMHAGGKDSNPVRQEYQCKAEDLVGAHYNGRLNSVAGLVFTLTHNCNSELNIVKFIEVHKCRIVRAKTHADLNPN